MTPNAVIAQVGELHDKLRGIFVIAIQPDGNIAVFSSVANLADASLVGTVAQLFALDTARGNFQASRIVAPAIVLPGKPS